MSSFMEEFAKNRTMRTVKDGIVNFLAGVSPQNLEALANEGGSIMPSVEWQLMQKYGAAAIAKQCQNGLPFLRAIDDKDLETLFSGITAYSVRHRDVLEQHKPWAIAQLKALLARMIELGG